jgi:carbon storage regulator
MLVLSRKERERIRLGDSIVVTIVRVSGDKVRIGIEAPPDVLVLRDELESREATPSQVQPRQVQPRQAQPKQAQVA